MIVAGTTTWLRFGFVAGRFFCWASKSCFAFAAAAAEAEAAAAAAADCAADDMPGLRIGL